MLESSGRSPHIRANLWGNHVRNQDIDRERIWDLYRTQPKKSVKSKHAIVVGTTVQLHTHTALTQAHTHTLPTPQLCSIYFLLHSRFLTYITVRLLCTRSLPIEWKLLRWKALSVLYIDACLPCTIVSGT